ncbi:carboxypeptidase-like regulatory domain-containing protein [Myxococcus stipitatus]|uniref:carboxypeptidase-like regulatory domain-containing protein n=1 Tax=Myxococcus stipitatus TaxID=83455 RepID=UPI001F28320E|nr:carboxypeptidase-like regulatory domain-containing protein [Myxococcus stipitatus]MCE9668601.1 carboxypeptidase-like regulatory domain-containing protein [Myxococcus stipitatus]
MKSRTHVRKRLVVVSGIGVLLIAVSAGVVLLRKSPDVPRIAAPRAPSSAASRATIPSAPTSGALSIQGFVLRGSGPVAGVQVTLTRAEPGRTLSTKRCVDLVPEDYAYAPDKELALCLRERAGLLLEGLTAREGESTVVAQTVSGADGGFTFEALAEGSYALWALDTRGAFMRAGVLAGEQGVRLHLAEGVVIEGQVIGDGNVPLAGVRVTAVHPRQTLFFDTETDSAGRFAIGPLPPAEYMMVYVKEGWSPGLGDEPPTEPVWLRKLRTLTGQVVRDGAPVGDVPVVLEAGDNFQTRGGWNHAGSEQRRVTDAQGRFHFDALAPAGYRLVASHEAGHDTRQVDLSGNEASADIVLKLGNKFLVEGFLRDEAGDPIAGAPVSGSAPHETLENLETTTDEAGRFLLGPMAEGAVYVTASPPGFVRDFGKKYPVRRGMAPLDHRLEHAHSVRGTFVDEEERPVPHITVFVRGPTFEKDDLLKNPSLAISDDQGRFQLDFASPGTIDLEVDPFGRFLKDQRQVQAPSTDLVWVLERGARVMGSVLDEQGMPVLKALVRQKSEETKEDLSALTWTDERGRYELAGLRAGRFTLSATWEDEGAERSASQQVELAERDVKVVDFRAGKGGTVSGIAVTPTGEPLSDVELYTLDVAAMAPGPNQRLRPQNQTPLLTRADGRFSLRDLQAREVMLFARRAGFEFAPHLSRGGTPTDEAVRVEVGNTDVKLVLEPLGRIQGKVVGPDGKPLTHFRLGSTPVVDPGGAFVQYVRNEHGWTLNLNAEGMASLVRTIEHRHPTDVVDLGEVRMTPGRLVTGRLMDDQNSKPVQTLARVFALEDASAPLERASILWQGQDGAFSFRVRDDSPVTLHIVAPGYLPKTMALGAGEQEDLVVRLDGGGRVELTVVGPTGQPVSAGVVLEPLTGGPEALPRHLLFDGTYMLQGMEAGTYLLQTFGRGRPPLYYPLQRIEVPASGTVKVRVSPARGPTLVLRVKTTEKVSAFVVCCDLPLPATEDRYLWQERRSVQPDESTPGALTYRNLPPGKAHVLVTRSWFSQEDQESHQEVHEESLDLPATGTVEHDVVPTWKRVK